MYGLGTFTKLPVITACSEVSEEDVQPLSFRSINPSPSLSIPSLHCIVPLDGGVGVAVGARVGVEVGVRVGVAVGLGGGELLLDEEETLELDEELLPPRDFIPARKIELISSDDNAREYNSPS